MTGEELMQQIKHQPDESISHCGCVNDFGTTLIAGIGGTIEEIFRVILGRVHLI